MGKFFDQTIEYFGWMAKSLWDWLFLLNQEEWMLLLSIVAVCGFLCLRGFGSRNNY